MSWKIFEEICPELATLGFKKLNRKIAYLATIKNNGSPRLHPVTPFIGNGMLFIFTEPSSPKIRDLCCDGRYALHCSVSREDPLFEILVMGSVETINDPDVRLQAIRIADSPVVRDDYVLFEFHIERVLVVEYDEQKKPIVRRWQRNRDINRNVPE